MAITFLGGMFRNSIEIAVTAPFFGGIFRKSIEIAVFIVLFSGEIFRNSIEIAITLLTVSFSGGTFEIQWKSLL